MSDAVICLREREREWKKSFCKVRKEKVAGQCSTVYWKPEGQREREKMERERVRKREREKERITTPSS